VSRCVGEAVKAFGSHNLRKRNTVGITPWGMINNNNNNDLIGRDVSLRMNNHWIAFLALSRPTKILKFDSEMRV